MSESPSQAQTPTLPSEQSTTPAKSLPIGTASASGPQVSTPVVAPTRPRPRPRSAAGTPGHIRVYTNPSSIFYDPQLAKALQAAIDNNIPVHGQRIPAPSPLSAAPLQPYTSPLSNPQASSLKPGNPTSSSLMATPTPKSRVIKGKGKPAVKLTAVTEAVTIAEDSKQAKLELEAKLELRREKARKRQAVSRKNKKQRTGVEPAGQDGDVVDLDPLGNGPDSTPKFDNDYGNDPAGPNATDILVSWMADPGNIERFKKSDTASKRNMMDEVLGSLQERGMALRTKDNLILKIRDILTRVTGQADKLRNQTGYGVEEEDGSKGIEEMLSKTVNGRMYLQLEAVLRTRHSVNPLGLHESAGHNSQTERQSLVDLLLLPAGSEDEEPLSDTELDESSPIRPGDGPAAGPSGPMKTAVDIKTTAKEKSNPTANKGKFIQPGNAIPVVDLTDNDVKPAVQQTVGKKTTASARPVNQPGEGANAGPDRKPKIKDEINKTVGDRFDNHLEHIKVRDKKLDEHLSLRDEQERERLELDRQRATREEERHRHELKLENQKHELQRMERFLKLLETPHLNIDSVGEAIYGYADWRDKQKVILAMIGVQPGWMTTGKGFVAVGPASLDRDAGLEDDLEVRGATYGDQEPAI